MHWVHGVVHGRVIPHEVNHFVRVVFGGLHVGGERTSGALRVEKKRSDGENNNWNESQEVKSDFCSNSVTLVMLMPGSWSYGF